MYHPEDPPASPWLKTAGEAVGLIAGAVALVYLLGGLIYALRMAFAGFSIEATVSLIGQLPREAVITAGFIEGLGPAALVGLVAALVYGAFDRPKPRSGTDDRLNKGPRWQRTLFGLGLLSVALVAPAVVLAFLTDGPPLKRWAAIPALAITFGLVCAGWFALRLLARKDRWYRLGHAVVAGAIWMGMALVPSIMFSAAVVFDSARVCVADEKQPVVTGDLIAQTKDRILLAQSEDAEKSVLSLPTDRVRRLEYGELPSTPECPAADEVLSP